MKLTKIVCTIGPASESIAILEKMVHAGMNVARLNFSHGTHENHHQLINHIRTIAKKNATPIAILQDLQGPRIRIGEMPPEGVKIEKGDKIRLIPEKEYKKSMADALPNQYAGMANDVEAGQHILIADGTMDLQITRVEGKTIHTKVLVGGTVKSHKGINVPGATLKVPPVTDKDKKDVIFGIDQGVDFVAMSFVKSEKDVVLLREYMKAHAKGKAIPGIIAKIERPEALENFDALLEAVDGIMIARGDLGLEIPASRVPVYQKEMIERCTAYAKPVIVATQMLESMTMNSRPTRAEVSDVANAVFDGTDAVMLSGESASGPYPVEAVQIMADTIAFTEMSLADHTCADDCCCETGFETIACGISAVVGSGHVAAVVTDEQDERFVHLLASYREAVPIILLTKKGGFHNRLNLSRGVVALDVGKDSKVALRASKLVKKGDMIARVTKDTLKLERI